MNSNNSARSGHHPSRRLSRYTVRTVAAAVVLGVAMVGCGGQGKDSGGDSGAKAQAKNDTSTGSKVLWIGDSIAGAEAPALGAALKASGVEFKDSSSDGGGTVVDSGEEITGMISADTWKQLATNIKSFHPTVVAYQVTTYDWGSADQQRTAYDKLVKTVKDAGAKLVMVPSPPVTIGDGPYKQHEAQMRTAAKTASEVAKNSGGAAVFLDASQLWGTDPAAKKALRSSDGVHNCQQGAATFAKWFTAELGKQAGFTPASVDTWAKGSWTGDDRYGKLHCGS
ncbi:SGNH/GDSL hydrolase family protein [Streptomyces sp. CBMA152]|uniref:SGNH/GDSL hydrolase family protein n=1 Tax=Streptomyces sp. CBMA152 TaxID=1896312 RepID=UPI0016600C51|nr:SGNH/GDSL hydrolase family protein [Streptomyces sp. CBMA152]MBD0742710.1 hypothetical protein [Streptomyces sp. CBMA152]